MKDQFGLAFKTYKSFSIKMSLWFSPIKESPSKLIGVYGEVRGESFNLISAYTRNYCRYASLHKKKLVNITGFYLVCVFSKCLLRIPKLANYLSKQVLYCFC